MAEVNPKNVYALVVGIETYQLGADYDLDGPARDGLRFIEWLRSHNVPADNIRFFVSPLAENTEVVSQAAKHGVNAYPATRDAIDKHIRGKLLNLKVFGEVLYVFWGGHGILTKTDRATRQLLFADTTAADKLNLNFESLQQALATSAHGVGFEKQFFIVDACANRYFQDLYEVIQAKAGEQQYSSTGEKARAEQVVMFACEAYDVARNVAGTGVFSSAVLAELKDRSLLPDMQLLMTRVRNRLLEQQMPEPYYLWVKVGNQETISDQREGLQGASASSKTELTGMKHLKTKRLQHQLDRVREQHKAESELLGETSGAIDAQREQTVERLERKIAQLENELKEVTR